MDCIDCHNRPTHVFLCAEDALDHKLVTGAVPVEIPFIKRQGLEALKKKYPSQDVATRGIADELMDWYRREYPEIVERQGDLLKKGVMGVQQAYVENVFPGMNIDWRTYMSFTCHVEEDSGCFRCHNNQFKTETGKTITQDCDACHVILVEDEPARDIREILKSSLTEMR